MVERIYCKRPRCRRWKDLNEFCLCGGHACPVPGCAVSKSNTVSMCEEHIEQARMKLPKFWSRAFIDGVGVYLNVKAQLAQYSHPGLKAADAASRSNSEKPAKRVKGMPILFRVEPQPRKLPEEWEKCVAVPPKNAAGSVYVYRNLDDGSVQSGDPTPQDDDSEDALPTGWTLEYDEDGDQFFRDHNTGVATYDDPRIMVSAKPCKTLMRGFQLRKMSEGRLKNMTVKSSGAKPSSKKVWQIGPKSIPEYICMEDNMTPPGELPEACRTKALNRYLDILPTTRTRVRLKTTDSDPTSEYINANYVRDYSNNPKRFIAAMGPKPATVDSFWQMVWENKCPAIVMATGLVEGGKRKCERYWPVQQDETLKFGDLAVTSTGVEYSEGFVVNVLALNKRGKRHTAVHYWYNTWPDHGVPVDASGEMFTDNVIGLIRAVEKLVGSNRDPILVHCSAGIGRTGALIAIQHAMHSLEKSSAVDVLQIIKTLRKDRPAMVQHRTQYEFVHEACIRYAERRKKKFEILLTQAEKEEAEEMLREFSAADMMQQRKVEKEAARRRLSTSATSGTLRGNLMRSSQVHGELRMDKVFVDGEVFEFMDMQGDGRMSFRDARMQGLTREAFAKLDTDKDGFVTLQDFRAYVARNNAW